MASRPFSRSIPFLMLICTSISVGGMFAPYPALAQQEVVDAIANASEQRTQIEKENAENLKKVIDTGINSLSATIVDNAKKAEIDSNSSAPIDEIATATMALPLGLATSASALDDIMFNRYRELNRIPLGTTASGKKASTADYLIDTSFGADNDVQAFSIFMRYFCDTRARQNAKGTDDVLKTRTYKLSGAVLNGEDASYEVGCGFAKGEVPSRQTYLGAKSNEGLEAEQVIGLPARPQVLFFAPETFPTKLAEGTSSDKVSNTNPLAHIYYSAFAQSLQFLLGSAPKATSTEGVGSEKAALDAQAEISRKMLASYPFAILFSERVGTLPGDPAHPAQSVATQVADLLEDKLGGATEDPVILARIDNIRRRNSISIAEYNDIVMYQLMLSPGYYERISTQLNATELRREEVWLTAMQTALNYQRNRWLEILAALEAVK